jgi:hypothetical protein
MAHLRRAEAIGNTTAIVNLFKTHMVSKMPGRADNTLLPYENAPRTPASPRGTRRYRRSEIRDFYERCRRGQYRDREAERARIEADILAAARENRIVDPPLKMVGEK